MLWQYKYIMWDLRRCGDAYLLKHYELVKGQKLGYVTAFGSLEAVKAFIDDSVNATGEAWSIEEPNEVC